MSLSRIYSWSIFAPAQSAWVHLRRSEMHGPGWWHAEARTQDGQILHSRAVTAEYAHILFEKYGKDAEVQFYS